MKAATATAAEQFNEAMATAQHQLDKLRQAAQSEAIKARDQLANETSLQHQRTQLAAIIGAAIEAADDATVANAPYIAQQLINKVQHYKVKQAADGVILLEVFADAAKELNQEQRKAALLAILIMAAGRADPGLYNFKGDEGQAWQDALTVSTLGLFAAILSPAAHQHFADTLNDLRVQRVAMAQQVEALSATVTITPNLEAAEAAAALSVEIENKDSNPAPITIAGMSFPRGRTRITAEQFDRVKASPLWVAGVNVGSLEVSHA
jgi:hypothetical protein